MSWRRGLMSLGYLSGFLKSFDVHGRTDTHGNIAFFTFHTFLVEVHPNEDKNRVRAKLYNCCACICNTTLRLRLQVPLGRPQSIYINCLLWDAPSTTSWLLTDISTLPLSSNTTNGSDYMKDHIIYLNCRKWPAPSWLDSLVGRALHRHCRGHGLNLGLQRYTGAPQFFFVKIRISIFEWDIAVSQNNKKIFIKKLLFQHSEITALISFMTRYSSTSLF